MYLQEGWRKRHKSRSLAGYSPWGWQKSQATEHAHTHEVTIPIAGNFRKLTEFPGADLNRDTGDLSSKSAGTTSLGTPEAQQRPRALTLLGSHKVMARKSVKISQTAALPAAEPLRPVPAGRADTRDGGLQSSQTRQCSQTASALLLPEPARYPNCLLLLLNRAVVPSCLRPRGGL